MNQNDRHSFINVQFSLSNMITQKPNARKNRITKNSKSLIFSIQVLKASFSDTHTLISSKSDGKQGVKYKEHHFPAVTTISFHLVAVTIPPVTELGVVRITSTVRQPSGRESRVLENCRVNLRFTSPIRQPSGRENRVLENWK